MCFADQHDLAQDMHIALTGWEATCDIVISFQLAGGGGAKSLAETHNARAAQGNPGSFWDILSWEFPTGKQLVPLRVEQQRDAAELALLKAEQATRNPANQLRLVVEIPLFYKVLAPSNRW